jgi:RNA polymerase sigma factor (sigma-70 family)
MCECSTSAAPGSESDLAGQMAAHERLVVWVVRRQWLGPLAFEEALQVGRIGLWQALLHYDPAYGTKFSTYAVPAIAHRIWREVARATKAQGRRARLTVDERKATDPEESLSQAQVAGELDALLATLPARLRAVVIAHHGWDGNPPQTFAALGRAQGVSRQRIHQLYVRALILLAHPAASRSLRALTGRQERSDYQQTLARQRQLARQSRRGRR